MRSLKLRSAFRSASETSPEHEVILLAVSAALFAWLMQAALDFYFHAEKTVPEALLLDIPARQLYSRIGITAAFILTGIIISKAVRRLKRGEARARRLDQCIRSVRAINQLITRVNNRTALCQRACEELVTGLGYHCVRAELDGVTHGFSELVPSETHRVAWPVPGGCRADPDEADTLSMPIACDGEVLGSLVVTLRACQTWGDEERALLNEVSEDIAFSVRSMRTSERLIQQREEVQTILDSVSAYITYKDRNGRYIRVNKALADMAGIPHEDWVGKTLSELAPGSDECCAYSDEEVMKTGRCRHTALESLELPGGGRWVQSDRVPYRDSSGAVIGVIALSVDVTDRMQAERSLACRDEQLRQSQKMEAIGQLAGGIAHDFNNLLTAISGYTELARASLKPTAAANDMLFAVSKAAERAAALTRQLLAFSRKQPLWLSEKDLNEIVAGMTEMLTRLIGEDIELVTELGEDVGKIEADASQIEQVLMNLAVNARDAMPHGGRLTVSTSAVAPEGTACGDDTQVA
ncbi:MAG: PAS domain-containing protein, partial [Candidatus Eisenbacteria bacterium]|nr:PAS domain-containing protein [Candidatus Eisenbacteria bacterium]